MTSMQPLWWFALPVLLLPVWWHMQKRQRVKSDFLATARFLPAADPQQQRVPRWQDRVLLAVRLLLLLALLAVLAVVTMPWRGDTVLLAPSSESSPWAEQQVAAAGMRDAQRLPLPADALDWIARNEHEWRPGARLLVLAPALPMPATPPRLAHATTIRIAPAAPAAAAASVAVTAAGQRMHEIVLAAPPERAARWRALLAAFATAGDGNDRYAIAGTPTPNSELVIWDHPGSEPPPAWRAPLWWRSAPLPAAAQPLVINGLPLHIAATPQGRTWTSNNWPLQDADAARALYETWQQLERPQQPYPMPAQVSAEGRKGALPAPVTEPLDWLVYALLALFAVERILSHVRRR